MLHLHVFLILFASTFTIGYLLYLNGSHDHPFAIMRDYYSHSRYLKKELASFESSNKPNDIIVKLIITNLSNGTLHDSIWVYKSFTLHIDNNLSSLKDGNEDIPLTELHKNLITNAYQAHVGGMI